LGVVLFPGIKGLAILLALMLACYSSALYFCIVIMSNQIVRTTTAG